MRRIAHGNRNTITGLNAKSNLKCAGELTNSRKMRGICHPLIIQNQKVPRAPLRPRHQHLDQRLRGMAIDLLLDPANTPRLKLEGRPMRGQQSIGLGN